MNNQSHPAVSVTAAERWILQIVSPVHKDLCFQLLSVGCTTAIFFCRIEPIFIRWEMSPFLEPFTSPVALRLADRDCL